MLEKQSDIKSSSVDKDQLNILLIDDDGDDGMFFYEALSELDPGINFIYGQHSAMLFKYIEAEAPDLIFLDINMPTKSGMQCLLELKANEKYSRIPVVMYSALSNERIIEESYKAGAYHYFVKPYAQKNFQPSLKKVFSVNWKLRPPRPLKENFVINLNFV